MLKNPIIYIILIILLTIFLSRKLRIAKENERFVIHVLGQYKGIKGPGLQIKWSGTETEWNKINVDDRGKAVTENMMRVHDVDVPYKSNEEIKIGDYLRIYSFDSEEIIAVLDADQRSSFVCEKCGHHNVL